MWFLVLQYARLFINVDFSHIDSHCQIRVIILLYNDYIRKKNLSQPQLILYTHAPPSAVSLKPFLKEHFSSAAAASIYIFPHFMSKQAFRSHNLHVSHLCALLVPRSMPRVEAITSWPCWPVPLLWWPLSLRHTVGRRPWRLRKDEQVVAQTSGLIGKRSSDGLWPLWQSSSQVSGYVRPQKLVGHLEGAEIKATNKHTYPPPTPIPTARRCSKTHKGLLIC